MSDLESYLTHCYDMVLQSHGKPEAMLEEELCTCSALLARNDQATT